MASQLLLRRPTLDDLPEESVEAKAATPADASELAHLLGSAFADDWDTARVHRDLLDDPTVEQVYIVRKDGRIVATASARILKDEWPATGYVHWVASDPELRGRGLGRAVTAAVLHRFEVDGLTSSVLETDDDRLAAITLYLGLGFVPQFREPGHEERWSKVFRELAAQRHPAADR